MNRTQKENVIAELATCFKESRAVFVTDFKGLTVDQMTGLRRKVDEAGADYRVSKNTLIKLAAKGTDAEGISELLTGNNALGTTTGDPVALAKALVDYAKGNDKFVVKGGVLRGRRLEFENIKALADLPGREVLLAQMLGAMNAVPGGFVRTLAAVPQGLVYALAAIKEQKEGQAA